MEGGCILDMSAFLGYAAKYDREDIMDFWLDLWTLADIEGSLEWCMHSTVLATIRPLTARGVEIPFIKPKREFK